MKYPEEVRPRRQKATGGCQELQGREHEVWLRLGPGLSLGERKCLMGGDTGVAAHTVNVLDATGLCTVHFQMISFMLSVNFSSFSFFVSL